MFNIINKKLYIFVPNNVNNPFPLFWSYEDLNVDDFDSLNEYYKNKIRYIFSDNTINFTPYDGKILKLGGLENLEIE